MAGKRPLQAATIDIGRRRCGQRVIQSVCCEVRKVWKQNLKPVTVGVAVSLKQQEEHQKKQLAYPSTSRSHVAEVAGSLNLGILR
jgi:hypothetical protein